MHDRGVESANNLFIVLQPGEQSVSAAPHVDAVFPRSRLGVARELFDAKQFRPQRQLNRNRSAVARQGRSEAQ
jgi:hypothetical protein